MAFKIALVLLFPYLCFAGTPRSTTAKNDFKRLQPCPSTGLSKGACKGYVIDHVKPLACGGADHPSNMQWQTVEEGKAKDKWERKQCQFRESVPTR